MYLCIYMCIIHMYKCVCFYLYMYLYVYYTYVHVCIDMYVLLFIHIYVYMYVSGFFNILHYDIMTDSLKVNLYLE